jgi:hypothetical protein
LAICFHVLIFLGNTSLVGGIIGKMKKILNLKNAHLITFIIEVAPYGEVTK